MADTWFVARENKQFGPFTAAQLKQLATTGKLKPEDLVWKDGTTNKVPARSVKGLFNGAASAPPVAQARAEEAGIIADDIPLKDDVVEEPKGKAAKETEEEGVEEVGDEEGVEEVEEEGVEEVAEDEEEEVVAEMEDEEEEEEEDRPKKSSRKASAVTAEAPRKSKGRKADEEEEEEDEDEAPKKSKARSRKKDEDEDEEEAPRKSKSRKKDEDEEDEDEPPKQSKSSKKDVDEEEDEEDEQPGKDKRKKPAAKAKSGGGGGGAGRAILFVLVGMGIMLLLNCAGGGIYFGYRAYQGSKMTKENFDKIQLRTTTETEVIALLGFPTHTINETTENPFTNQKIESTTMIWLYGDKIIMVNIVEGKVRGKLANKLE